MRAVSNFLQFSAEAIGAFRTVTSLTLEDMITARYDVLLQGHLDKAFRKARFSSMIFALSDSVNLLCMALTFYYGGKLLASREYGTAAFFVVYIAVINGSESAGAFLSFGPSKSTAFPLCIPPTDWLSLVNLRVYRFCTSRTGRESNSKLPHSRKAKRQGNLRARGYRRRRQDRVPRPVV
jgi:hypothetical protein